MRFIKKFENFIKEGADAPAKPTVKPTVKPTTRPEAPTKPERPTRPERTPDRVERPEADPAPKAEVKSIDVANRFIDEINKKGKSVKKYVK